MSVVFDASDGIEEKATIKNGFLLLEDVLQLISDVNTRVYCEKYVELFKPRLV